MSTVRQANPLISQAEARELGLDRAATCSASTANMLATRRIEERGNLLFKAGKLPGSYYTGRGNEAASVGVATAMGADDVASPLHRNLGVHVVRGVPPAAIFCQFMGRRAAPPAAATRTCARTTSPPGAACWPASATCRR